MSRRQSVAKHSTANVPAYRRQSIDGITQPHEINGMVAEFNPQSIVTTDGGNVDYWVDGHGLNTVAPPGTAPTIIRNQVNGYPIVRFTDVNVDNHLLSSTDLTVQTICLVLKHKTSPANTNDQGVISADATIQGIFYDAPGTAYFAGGPSNFYFDSEQVTADADRDIGNVTNWHLIIATYASQQSYTGLKIGMDRGNTQKWFAGDLAWVNLYSNSMSEADRVAYAAWVSNRFGIF